MKRIIIVMLLALTAGNIASSAAEVVLPELSSVPHPRLMLKAGEEKKVRETIAKVGSVAAVDKAIVENAVGILAKPLAEAPNETRKGFSDLQHYRNFLQRMFALCYTYRVHGDKDCGRRAVEEMRNMCSWPKWTNSNGGRVYDLVTSETLVGMAIGYDWLYGLMSKKDRELFRRNMVERGINPSFLPKAENLFYRNSTNWNQVCNAGAVMGALAVMEDEPELAVKVVERALEGNVNALKVYAPQGAYPEGYTYWSYGTTFEVFMLDALEYVFGTDFGLSDYPGFRQSPYFVEHMVRPTGSAFNFSDSGGRWKLMPVVFWFAAKDSNPSLAYLQDKFVRTHGIKAKSDRVLPTYPIYFSRLTSLEVAPPTDNYFVSEENTLIFAYRSGWDGERDSFLGLKAGKDRHNHCHMDVGEFVYTARGVDWGIDLGSPDYNIGRHHLKGFFNNRQDSERWTVFRCTADSHNVPMFDGALQNVDSLSVFEKIYRGEDGRHGAVINLSPSYAGQVESIRRSAWVDDAGELTVEDAIVTGDSGRDYTFTLQTPAVPKVVSDREVTLTAGTEKALLALDASGLEVRVELLPNGSSNPWDRKEPAGNRRVRFHVAIPAGTSVIVRSRISFPE